MSAIFTDVDASFALAVEHVTQAEFDSTGLNDWLTDEEQARYDELRTHAVAKRTRQWLLGRYAAKLACRRWLREQRLAIAEWKAIQISNDQNGMPLLTMHDTGESLALSIAHSGEEAVAAVAAHGQPIGVDIESMIPRKNLRQLAKRICSEYEYQHWIVGSEKSEVSECFYRLWLAKEAVSKCHGEGLKWHLAAAEVMQCTASEVGILHGGNRYTGRYLQTGKSIAVLVWKL